MLQRRAVLAALGSAMAVSFAPIKVLAGTKVTRRNQFAELIGARLQLEDSEGNATVARLATLDDGPHCPGLEQFSIVIEGDGLVDGIHEVHNRDLGNMPISLLSSECDNASRTRKRAHFSLLSSSSSRQFI